MGCPICSHPERAQIENVVLSNPDKLDAIAQEFKVTTNDLKIHMVMHAAIGVQSTETLARKCKTREADMLLEVANEYMVTLKSVGRRIKEHVDDPEVKFEKTLTKPVADLYIGLGAEIRATVKTLSELDQALNGPKEDPTCGLAGLTQVLAQSIGAQKDD